MTDVALNLDLDFERKVFDGSATLTLEKVDKNAKKLVS